MATRLSNPSPRFFYDNGTPLSSGKLWFYEPGTTTPKNTYSDNALSVPNTNPVILSSSGLLPNVYLDGVYKVLLTDKDDVQQSGYPRDNVNSIAQIPFAAWDSTINYGMGGTNIVYASDGEYYVSIQNNNIGHDPTVSPLWWTPLAEYLIAEQGLVGNNEVAVGDTTDGLKGIAITNGFFVIGDTTNGIAGLDGTAKGAIIVGDGTGAPQARTVGTNGQVLTADSGETTGVKWAEPTTGLRYLSTVNASGATNVDIETGFGATYDNYLIVGSGITLSVGTSESVSCRLKLGGSYLSTSTYYGTASNGTADTTSDTSGGVSGSQTWTAMNLTMWVYDVNSSRPKMVANALVGQTTTPGGVGVRNIVTNSDTGALTGVRLFCAGGATITGTFRLYGIANS